MKTFSTVREWMIPTAFGAGILMMIVLNAAFGQTKADATSQLKNLMVSPIASVQRWNCTASGTGTSLDGTTYTWDCNGLSMIRIVLVDGTVVGPFAGVTANVQMAANANWVTIPLAAPTPAAVP